MEIAGSNPVRAGRKGGEQMNEYEWEELKKKVRNALAILTCNIPDTKKEIVEEIQKIYEMVNG